LDGELYNHDYRTKFEELTALIRPETPREGHKAVQYHIYDAAGPGEFSTRLKRLNELAELPRHVYDPLRFVETVAVSDEDDLMKAFEIFLAQGYEGAMVRNADGLYVNKRSYDLQKVKEFTDSEFTVVDVEEGRGKLAGHGIFVCKTKDGVEFRAKMVGALEALQKFFNSPRDYIGKSLTVKYQGLTAAGIPRFPVALRFKEDV
jgi:DNA ligase-1